jgi:hypothetical protein
MTRRMIPSTPSFTQGIKIVLVTGVLFGNTLLLPALAQSPSPAPATATGSPAPPPPAQTAAAAVAGPPTRYQPNRFAGRAGKYYSLAWGVDGLSVKAVESGKLIRFSYRVVDPSKAKVFNDKKIDAFLDSPAAHARLVIPTLEKVGQLRQYNNPVPGMSYWMAFSNPRTTVKKGDRVNVVIGQFHADGLVVE